MWESDNGYPPELAKLYAMNAKLQKERPYVHGQKRHLNGDSVGETGIPPMPPIMKLEGLQEDKSKDATEDHEKDIVEEINESDIDGFTHKEWLKWEKKNLRYLNKAEKEEHYKFMNQYNEEEWVKWDIKVKEKRKRQKNGKAQKQFEEEDQENDYEDDPDEAVKFGN